MTVDHERIEQYARGRFDANELLTWHIDDVENIVTFFVPTDVSVESFPEEMGGARVETRTLPRPIAEVQ
jgi:hypothetical protein